MTAVSVAMMIVIINFFTASASMNTDRMTFGSTLAGNDTLVSNGGIFELGLFTPVGTSGRYLGVWYHGLPGPPTVVWVANRQSPVLDSDGEIRLSAGGQLQVLDSNETVFWSSTAGNNVTGSGSARLLDSGNFVISYDDGRSIFWQSFDHPTDTLLPGMHLGDLGSKVSTSLTAWKNLGDPSPGNLKFQLMQGSGLTQFELVNETTVIYATSPWNGAVTTSGLFSKSTEFNFNVVSGSFHYSTRPSLLSRVILDSFGLRVKLSIWINNKWVDFSYYPSDPCDTYGYCGANGYCDIMKTPLLCTCLPGFKPRSASNWSLRDFSNGCVHQKSLECSANKTTDGFRLFKGKLPETKSAKTYNGFFSVDKCQHICLSNCSCRAFTASSIGCTIWTGDLLDMRRYNSHPEQEVYIRVAHNDASPSPTADPQSTHHSKSHQKKTIAIALSVIAGIIAIVIICVLLHSYGLVPWKRGSDIESFMKTQGSSQPRWPVKYTYAQLKRITRSFSVKLGTGGYGTVYQGDLTGPSNVPVAVKILTNKTGRGEDFENEITTISRASHLNIISLIGYCLEGSHRALVYEYMQNGCLNLYKFGSITESIERKQLHWQTLYKIITGVARGIDYLYTGCRTQILHFDIKPENILLDQNLCPKISDFGLARLCNKKETEISISGARGTPGYMAPEVYSRQYGKPSSKSDIYSFGMVILDMVGAKKMKLPSSGSQTFPSCLFDRLDEFCSQATNVNNDAELVNKMVIVALHCVQIDPAQRPSPSKLLEMLESRSFKLNLPLRGVL